MPFRFVVALVFFAFGVSLGFAQPLEVLGINDRSDNHVNTASFIVPTTLGHSYLVLLDGKRVPAGATNRVVGPDYHEISVWRTNVTTGQVTNRLVRFVIMNDRGDSERGLVAWTPYPQIPSANAEFAGATLNLMAPASYPAGMEIPVIARVDNPSGHARRVNGELTAGGFPPLRILRGHGSGFLPAGAPLTTVEYSAQIGSIGATKEINIDAATTWTTVSGVFPGNVTWADDSRIHLTGNITIQSNFTLTIGAGTVVKINPLVNITNRGRLIINGTTDRPVVLTATNRVAPQQHTYPWGGILMRNPNAQFIVNNAIIVGGGGQDGFSGTPPGFGEGDSHRDEQAVFLVHSNSIAHLTNCAIINTAGQVGNGYNSDFIFDHCLFQRAITCGEYVGGRIVINESALIEFPEDNGTVNTTIANFDYDGIYFTTGTHLIYNSLLGFCKDDAIDSGSGGAGTVLLTNCWIESALHEANAWSGSGRVAENYGSVLMNSGQGFECGWSSGSGSPLTYAGNLLSIGNSVGARFGDNYDDIGPFNGTLRVTNSFILHNYRDVWGMTWRNDATGWFYRSNQMDIRNNFLSQANPFHPNNTTWDGPRDGWRLAQFMTTPPDAPVGIGFATWTTNLPIGRIFEGIPVRLSIFTTNTVQVDYAFQSGAQPPVTGTLTFLPGETVKRIFPYGLNVTSYPNPRVILANPVGGELTGNTNVQFQGTAPGPAPISFFRSGGAPSQHYRAQIQDGHPLGLSAPSGLPITFGYQYETPGGILSTGVIAFAPGETIAWASGPEGNLDTLDIVRFRMPFGPFDAYYFDLPPPAPLPPPLIAWGSVWRYPNVAGQLAATWKTAAFSDAAWQSGPSELGFGDGDEARAITRFTGQITYYFRKSITVDDPSAYTNLSLTIRRDDGAVMYFNGTEVFRSSSMPALPAVITFTTEANNEGENIDEDATLSRAGLVAGDNLVAVEVHQDDPGSSDISFNVELTGNPVPVPPSIYILRFGTQLLVAWNEPRYTFEQATTLDGPWAPFSQGLRMTSPFVIPYNTSVGQRFFRLTR